MTTTYSRNAQFHVIYILTAILPGGPGLPNTRMSPVWILLELSGGDKICKAPVKSSPSTNQHPTFYRPDALTVAKPTVSKQ